MKKDIQNVVITFSLIAVMLYGGSFFYAQKVDAEQAKEERMLAEVEKTTKAQEILEAKLFQINIEQEQQLAELRLKKAPVPTPTPTVVPVVPTTKKPVTTLPVNTIAAAEAARIAKQQADLAQKQADAALLAQQVAAAQQAAKLQAKADAAAAAKTAAAKKARTSRAS
jgi:type IV secretory pathway VirB10-like protein